MKVLFAVGNEKISETIIKKYQQDYKEIITQKNVYYFNAIQKELQKDKSYDRIIISEDLEAFSNNNYDEIDRFIFGKLDNISDEAANNAGTDIPIILICNDRRSKSEAFLVKIFGIGIYSALIGQDRSITEVCKLLNKPRTKKEAKVYYKIDSDEVDYRTENEEDVSEVEIQNILTHYKKLGRNEEKYVESFNSIAAQYTDAQLRLIAQFLPLNVKAVLEANCEKYQRIVSFNTSTSAGNKKAQNAYQPPSIKVKKVKSSVTNEENKKIKLIEDQLSKNKLTKPVIIPKEVDTTKVKKVKEGAEEKEEIKNNINTEIEENIESKESNKQEQVPAKKRGRPKKEVTVEQIEEPVVKKRRGRPKKNQAEDLEKDLNELENNKEINEIVNLFDMDDEEENTLPGFDTLDEDEESENESVLPGFDALDKDEETENETVLPGFDDLDEDEETENETVLPGFDTLDEDEETEKGSVLPGFDTLDEDEETENESILPGLDNLNGTEEGITLPNFESLDKNENDELLPENNKNIQTENMNKLEKTEIADNNVDLSKLLTKDKKIVAFVGTSKNGTSFIVNNLAQLLSNQGIKTAILDLTKNKNAYYVYTNNQEELRQTAFASIPNLVNGTANGIQVNKNLTIFTTLPNEDEVTNNYSAILETLLKNYSLILLDCDFNTNYGYFKEAQEIYLVQSLDVLTIQPLTAFLRELKTKNILNPEKLRIVLNKTLRVRNATEKLIIGGISVYNDPAMSFMTELFNKDLIKYCSIPFEEQTYSRYLEGLIDCKITLKGYSKKFLMYLSKLGNMVYPLISNTPKKATSNYNAYTDNGVKFTNQINATLNKMKNNY